MSKKKNIDIAVRSIAVIGSLVFVNIVGLGLFGRLDLTRDKQFTLSRASVSTMRALEDPVTVRAYFSEGLPAPYSSNARYVKDLLDEYYAAGKGMFSYEFIDPLSEETAEDKAKKKDVKQDIFGRTVREATTIEKELQTLGIPSVQVRVNQDDKLEVKRAYMGLAVKYGEETEAIPLVKETAGLEYDLTTLIRKLTRSRTPKVALVTRMQPQEFQQTYGRMYGLLGQLFDVTTLNLDMEPEIAEDVDAIVVLGPKAPFTGAQAATIDAFVSSGRSAAFLLNAVVPDLQTMQAVPTDHGLADLLATYGVTIGEGLVVDAECATINVQQQRGFMRIAQPVNYPLMPLPRSLDPEHPLTRGLAQVAFPFSSPLSLALPADSKAKGEVLVRSSAKSFVQLPPYNLDPFQRWTPDMVQDEGSKGLLITLSGALKAAGASESASSDPADADSEAASARVLVSGGASFVSDQFMSKTNEAFVLNLIDWLVLDEDLLAVRSRGLAAATLGSVGEDGAYQELSEGTRRTVKYLNILGVPLAFVGFGLVWWRRRESRRAHATL